MQTTSRKRIAERYTGPLNEQQTSLGIAAVKANVEQLASAAETLTSMGIHSLSCAMSILAVEESQKASLLLGLLYADTPEEVRQFWKELRDHRKKHSNIALDIASSAIVDGTIAPADDAAIERKMKEAPDPNILEELKQSLIYCDCIIDTNGLPAWCCPAEISRHTEADARRLLQSAQEAAEHIYLFSEEELRVWKRHMTPVRSQKMPEVLEQIKKCESELEKLGLPIPKRLARLTSEDGSSS
jgi:AbiV family abortive infection protein